MCVTGKESEKIKAVYSTGLEPSFPQPSEGAKRGFQDESMQHSRTLNADLTEHTAWDEPRKCDSMVTSYRLCKEQKHFDELYTHACEQYQGCQAFA